MNYTAPKLTPRQQALVDGGLLPFMLRFGGRTTVRIDEVAKEISMSPDFLRDLVTIGAVEYVAAKAKGERPTYILTTRSVLLWLLANSNVDAAEWEDTVAQWLALQPRAALQKIAALVHARLERTAR